jgi:hypothetical protein
MDGRPQQGTKTRGRSTRARSSTAVATPMPGGMTPATRSTYRLLLSRGLEPDEAATLTAFMNGIPINGAHWSIGQVNQLLFLRAMVRTGRFGARDGRRVRPN